MVTTDSRHNLPIAPNLLNRDSQPAHPNAVWASDITYIQADEGWLYLAVVLDLYSRQVASCTACGLKHGVKRWVT